MSHIHLPDGILPLWVWILGFVTIGIWVAVSSALTARHQDARKKIPLAAVAAALIVVAMSVPIAPIPLIPVAYHANLSVLAGAIVGPLLAPIVALIVQLVLWLVGHGGTTTLGLNASVLALEMVVGWLAVQAVLSAVRNRGRVRAAALFFATVGTLALTTTLMLGVVSTAGDHIELHAHEAEAEHEDELSAGGGGSSAVSEEDDHDEDEEVSLDRFAAWIYTVAPVGWALEGLATAVALGFILRVRPGLVRASAGDSAPGGDEPNDLERPRVEG